MEMAFTTEIIAKLKLNTAINSTILRRLNMNATATRDPAEHVNTTRVRNPQQNDAIAKHAAFQIVAQQPTRFRLVWPDSVWPGSLWPDSVWRDSVWLDFVWPDSLWPGVAWFDLGLLRFGVIRFGLIWFGLIRFGLIWFGLVRFACFNLA